MKNMFSGFRSWSLRPKRVQRYCFFMIYAIVGAILFEFYIPAIVVVGDITADDIERQSGLFLS